MSPTVCRERGEKGKKGDRHLCSQDLTELWSDSGERGPFFDLDILPSEFPGTELKPQLSRISGLGKLGDRWGKLAFLKMRGLLQVGKEPPASCSVRGFWIEPQAGEASLLSAKDEPKGSS